MVPISSDSASPIKKRRLLAACLSGEDGCPSVKRNGRRAQARQRRASGTAYCSCTRGEGEALSTQLKKPASGLKPSGNDDSRRGLEATTQVGASGNAPRARDRRRMARTAPRAWFTRARPEGRAQLVLKLMILQTYDWYFHLEASDQFILVFSRQGAK